MTITIPPPNAKQEQFLQDTHKYVCYGGARGGGKSWALRAKAIVMGFAHAGIRQMILRRTYPELYANHIKPMLAMLPVGTYRYNDSKKELILANGSEILFRYCSGEKDLPNFQGLETDILYIDEATQIEESVYQQLLACVRGANDHPKRVYLTCNPGGVGHQWVKRLFVDKEYRDGENPDDYSFISAGVRDNPVLMSMDPDYIHKLEALPPRKRKAWLDGDWNVLEGQFFEEWRDDPAHYADHQWTHVIDPFQIPSDWKIYRSLDWGYNKPFSVGWWAVDYDGVLYRIMEWYGCARDEANVGLRLTAAEVFSKVHETEVTHPWLKGKKIIGVADPAIWGTQTGVSIAEDAAKQGVIFSPGDNNRLQGWQQVHYRLAFDDNGYAMMRIFKTCKGFVRTIPTLQYDDHKVEDLDTDGEDHILDETRYMCMCRQIKPVMPKEPDKYYESPLWTALEIPKGSVAPTPPRKRLQIIKEDE